MAQRKKPEPGSYEEMYVNMLGSVPWQKEGGVLPVPNVRERVLDVADQVALAIDRTVNRPVRSFLQRLAARRRSAN